MKKFALLFLVLLALSASSAFAATATIGGVVYNLGEVNSGKGWETNVYGNLNLYTDYAGGSIAIAVDDADDPVILFYGESGDGEVGTVTVKGSISVTGGFLRIEDFGIGNTLTIDYTGGTKYALDGGENMTLHNGTVKIIAPKGKAYDVMPNMDPWGAGPTAVLEVVVVPDIDAAVTAKADDTSKIDVVFMKDKAKDDTVEGTFSYRILSGDMLGVDDSHEDVVAMGDGNASAGMASISRAKPSQKPAGFGDEKNLSEILEAGKTYTLHFMTSGANGSIPAYYDSQRVKFVTGAAPQPDTFAFTAAISAARDSATVTFRKNGAVWSDLSGMFSYELYNFGSTEPVETSSAKEAHAEGGVAACSFGRALPGGTYELEITPSIDLNPDFKKYWGKKASFKVQIEGLPFGDTEIDDLPDNGATLSATQNAQTGDVTLSIVNPDLEDGESVTFHFVEGPKFSQSEETARTASRSVSAALTVTKNVKAAADGKTFTTSLTQKELSGLKDGSTYAIEYINEDGSVLGYSTFSAGGLKYKAKSDDNGGDDDGGGGGGGGGCDAGFGTLALTLAAYVTTLRKKN